MVHSLTIGVPIRNEEKSLPFFIENLKSAVEKLGLYYPSLSIEILFCLNNTTDRSEIVIRELSPCYKLKNYSIVYSDSPGKFAAIREIAKSRELTDGYICFIDADVILDDLCIVNLVRLLQENKNTFLVYSSVLPVTDVSTRFMERIQKTHYLLRKYVSPRRYFHGRTYMMRSDIFLKEEPRTLQDYRWNLQFGPFVDDIYLSRLIVHNCGTDSLKESKNSKLWFIPPQNVKDFYFWQRRLLLEIKRLDMLYPEHSYVQEEIFRKKVYWSYFLNLEPKYFFLYLLYFLVEEGVRFIIQVEILLILMKLKKCKSIWKTLNSTKGGANENK